MNMERGQEGLIQRIFSLWRSRSDYQEYLLYKHRNFDVKGLTTQGIFTLELEQVFVDLGLGPQARHRMSADPIRPMPKGLRRGRHTIWAYLTAKQMENRNLVIIGPPGSGKTTLLKYITLSLAAPQSNGPAARVDKLPILLFLRNHADAIRKNPTLSLVTAVQERVALWEKHVPAEWLQTRLEKGECLVMLDGLDEVADAPTRRQVVAWVERQIGLYRGNQFIVTSRPFGYRSNPLDDVTVLEVYPFTIEQVERFVHNWYLANEIMSAQKNDMGVRMEARNGAEDLLMRLRRTPTLLEMSVNPLLLTMIATVHRYRSSLPGRRVELYAEICEVFLGKAQQARGLRFNLTPAQKQRVLQPLAYQMMQFKQREIPLAEAERVVDGPLNRVSPHMPAKTFLEDIENHSGLLIELEAGIYSFAHLTFQEYLAAVHVLDQKLEHELLPRVEDSWWHEAIRLYAAQTDATNVIRACLTRKKPSILALTLAMECLDEAREVRPELRTIFDKLAQSVEHNSAEVRAIAAEVQLTLRLRRMAMVEEGKYLDNSFITNAEYQLFLNEEREYGYYYQPDQWPEYRFPSGEGLKPVVGVRPSDAVAFCRWLSDREPGEWRYRLPQVGELDVLEDDSNSQSIHNNISYWSNSGKGFKSAVVDFSGKAFVEQLTRRMQEQLAEDWELHRPPLHTHVSFAGVQALVGERARRRQFKLLDLERTNVPNSELSADFNRIRDRATRARTHHLVRMLEDSLAQIQKLSLARARQLELDGVINLVEVLVQDIEGAADLVPARDLIRRIEHDLVRAREFAANQNQVLFQSLIRALSGALRHGRDLRAILDQAHIRARTRIRAHSIVRIVELLQEFEKRRSQENTPAGTKKLQRLLNNYIDLYIDFAILEARMEGKLPALEGIRIVREGSLAGN